METGKNVIDQDAPINVDIFSREKEKQKIIVKMPNGTTEEMTIPAPTFYDLKWANIVNKKSKDWREKQASKAIIKSEIWKVLFLLEQTRIHNKQNNNNEYFDINCRGRRDKDMTLLGHTTFNDDTNRKDIAILLIAYGVDMEQGQKKPITTYIQDMRVISRVKPKS